PFSKYRTLLSICCPQCFLRKSSKLDKMIELLPCFHHLWICPLITTCYQPFKTINANITNNNRIEEHPWYPRLLGTQRNRNVIAGLCLFDHMNQILPCFRNLDTQLAENVFVIVKSLKVTCSRQAINPIMKSEFFQYVFDKFAFQPGILEK